MVIYLQGTFEEECYFDLRQLFPEACGLAAAVNISPASQFVYDSLLLQVKRGEAGAGIVSADNGRFHYRKRKGAVTETFLGDDFKASEFSTKLPGSLAIGHTRYPTQGGSDDIANIHPLIFNETKYGPFAIAHNGQLTNTKAMREQLLRVGTIFRSTTDTELFAHMVAKSEKNTLEDAIAEAAERIPVAYSFLFLTPSKVIAMRDRFGVRPLSVAQVDSAYVVCSETWALDQFSGSGISEDLGIAPGEMLIFRKDTPQVERRQYTSPQERWCVFEGIYFSHPRSRIYGEYHEDFRLELGKQLAIENEGLSGSCVVPVLDSGKYAAKGLASALSIEYCEAFTRNHHPPRTANRSFTAATMEERKAAAYKKLHLRPDLVKGKDVIVVDDSIVRSTTMTIITERLRDAGARYISVCVSSPPITDVCLYGMDFQVQDEIIARGKSIDEVRKVIGADHLIYLSKSGLHDVVRKTYNAGICTACFGEGYPTKP